MTHFYPSATFLPDKDYASGNCVDLNRQLSSCLSIGPRFPKLGRGFSTSFARLLCQTNRS